MLQGRRRLADSCGGEGEPQGIGAACTADGVGDGAGESYGTFETFDLRTEDELLGGADRLDGVHDLCAEVRELAGEVQHGHGLEAGWGVVRQSFGHTVMVQGAAWHRVQGGLTREQMKKRFWASY